jgi:hypothetical protein
MVLHNFTRTFLHKIINNFSDAKNSYPLYEPSKIMQDPHFNNSLPTMMYLDGYRENDYDISGRIIMIDAFLTRDDYNVIFVNWDKIAGGSYVFDAFPNSKKVSGHKLAFKFHHIIIFLVWRCAG